MKFSMRKLAHKVLAVAVSASMVCSLTPFAAWAASSGSSNQGTGIFSDNGDSTATGSTVVKPQFTNEYDSKFSMEPGAICFENKGQLEDYLKNGEGFVAVLEDAPTGIHDVEVEWYFYSAEYNTETSEYEIVKGLTEEFLLSETYGTPNNRLSYSGDREDLFFTFPNYANRDTAVVDETNAAMDQLLDSIMGDGMFALRCVIVSASGGDDATKLRGVECASFVIVNAKYDFQAIYSVNTQTGTTDESYGVSGNLFQEGAQVPELAVTPGVTSGNSDSPYGKILAKATGSSAAETISADGAVQFEIRGVTNPDDGLYYQGALNVFTDLPSELEGNVNIGDTVNVYTCENGVAKVYEGIVCGPLNDSDGTTDDEATDPADFLVHFVVTGSNSTPFNTLVAVGVPIDGTYNLTTECTEGGILTPEAADGLPRNTPVRFVAQAVFPGYEFKGFELYLFGDTTVTPIDPANLGYNLFDFNPAAPGYGIEDGDDVKVRALFEKAPATDNKKFTAKVSLSGNNGATGNATAYPATLQTKESGGTEITMGSSKNLTNWSAKDGLFIQFGPENSNNSFVKDVELEFTNNTTQKVAINGNSMMLGYVPTTLRAINITYDTVHEPGEPVVSEGKVTVTAHLDSNSQKRASFEDGTKEFDSGQIKQGSSVTINLTALGNYTLRTVKINGVDYAPESVCTIDGRNAQLQLPSVMADYDIEFGYKYGSTTIEVTPGEGGEAEWITSNNSNGRSAISPYALTPYDLEENRTTTLENDGDRARLKIKVNAGYTLGAVKLAGVTLDSNYFVKRVGTDGFDYYTITFVKADYTGFVETDAGEWEIGDGGSTSWNPVDPTTPDKVWPVLGENLNVDISYNPTFILSEQTYYTVTTEVGATGGGAVTPTARFAADEPANIWFYPDNGYKVSSVMLDGADVAFGASNSTCSLDATGLHLVIDENGNGLQSDHAVHVEFTRGTQDYTGIGDGTGTTVNISSSVMAGIGVVSPEDVTKAYKGEDYTFSLFPATNYGLDSISLDNDSTKVKTPGTDVEATETIGSQTVKIERNLVTLTSIQTDHTLIAYFRSVNADVNPTYTVNVSISDDAGEPANSASVLGPSVVAAGSNSRISLLPSDGYSVSNIWVTAGGTGNSVDMLHMVENNELLIQNVTDNYDVQIVYVEDEEATYDYNTLFVRYDPSLIGDGVLSVSPNLATKEFLEDGNTGHATDDLDITVTLAENYVLGDDGINVLTWNAGQNKWTNAASNKWAVTDLGNGVYSIHIDKTLVTEDMGISVDTKVAAATAVNPTLYKIYTNVIDGKGSISPSGNAGYVELERGKSQTFSFLPDEGYKLEKAYLGENMDVEISTPDNKYTVNNIQSDLKISAVFTPLSQGEEPQVQPQDKVRVNIALAEGSEGLGTPDPFGNIDVIKGSSLTVTAIPNEAGYVAHVYVGERPDSNNEIAMTGSTATINNIQANTQVWVKYAKMTTVKKIIVDSANGGYITPGGTMDYYTDAPVTQTLSVIPDEGKAIQKIDVYTTDTEGNKSSAKSIDWATPSNNPSYITAVDPGSLSFAVTVESGSVTIKPNFVNKDNANVAKGPSGDPLPNGDDIRGKGNPDDKIDYAYVTAISTGWGVVTQPDPNSVVIGKTMALAVTPLANSQVTEITVNGKAISESQLQTVRENKEFVLDTATIAGLKDGDAITVEGTFARIPTSAVSGYYPVFTTVMTEGGVVWPGGKDGKGGKVDIPAGGNVTLSIIPDPGYVLDRITINDSSPKGTVGSSYTLYEVDENKNINVFFKKDANAPAPPLTNKIEATSSVNGTISPSGVNRVVKGADSIYSFVPADGYVLSYIQVDGIPYYASSVKNMQYTFPAVDSDHTIHAVFVEASQMTENRGEASISVGTIPNGTISYGTMMLGEHTAIPMWADYDYYTEDAISAPSFTIAPNMYYKIKDVLVGGTPVSRTSTVRSLAVGGGVTVTYTYYNGVLTLFSTTGDTSVSAVMEQDGEGRPSGPDETEYVNIKGHSTGEGGASGTTSIGSGVDIAVNPDEDPQLYPVSVVPGEGDIAGKITVTYGNGQDPGYIVEYTPEGVKAYEVSPNGTKKEIEVPQYVKDGAGNVYDIYEQGYLELNVTDVAECGGATVDTEFREMTPAEEARYSQPDTFDIHVNYSGGGKVYPSASVVPVKAGVSQLIQMIPNYGYVISSVMVDGTSLKADDIVNNCYVFENVDANHTIDVTFSYENPPTETYRVETSVDGNTGGLITTSTDVPFGSSFEVQFMADDTHKVSQIKVDGLNGGEWTDYSSPIYKVKGAGIESGATVNVSVKFAPLGPGEEPTTYKYVDVTTAVGGGAGNVSPSSDKAIAGMPKTFYLTPNSGYTIDYATFNGNTTKFQSNANSITVFPKENGENKLMVYFKRPQTNKPVTVDVDVTVEVAVSANVNTTFKPSAATGAEGKVSPQSTTVPYGSNATFYVFPNTGYTVASVSDITDGGSRPVDWRPVANYGDEIKEYTATDASKDNYQLNGVVGIVDDSNVNRQLLKLAAFGNAVYAGGALVEPAVFNGNAQLQAVADQGGYEYSRPTTEFYSCYEVTLENITGDIDLAVDFVKITDIKGIKGVTNKFKQVDTKVPNLVIETRNADESLGVAGTVTPIATEDDPLPIPQKCTQTITVEPWGSNFVQMVEIYEKDANGVYQLTGGVPVTSFNEAFDVTMGATDMKVVIVFGTVANPTDQMMNLALGDCVVVDDEGNIIHDNFPSGNNDFSVAVACADVDPSSIYSFNLSEGNRGWMQHRTGSQAGKNYEFVVSTPKKPSYADFWFTPAKIGEQDFVLQKVIYGGTVWYDQERDGGCTRTVRDVEMVGPGEFQLIFRALKPGEVLDTPLVTRTVYVTSEGEGHVSGPEVYTKLDISSTVGPLELIPHDTDDKYYIASEIQLIWDDEAKTVEEVPVREFADSSYTFSDGLHADLTIHVKFSPCAYVTTTWNNDEGFIMPNATNGKVLKFAVDGDDAVMKNFVIAPYSGYEVEDATVAIDKGTPSSVKGGLFQTADAREQLESAYDGVGFDSKNNEGAGVGEDASAGGTEKAQGASVMDNTYAKAMADKNSKSPSQRTFARAYSYTLDISKLANISSFAGERSRYDLSVMFTKEDNPNETYFYITTNAATVEHGKITPSTSPIKVPAGSTQSFTFTPENDNYVVASVIDNSVDKGSITSYTISNIQSDHTLNVTFKEKSTVTSGIDRLVRQLSSLAKTGDLTGPAVGVLLLIAALGLGVTAFSYIMRNRKIRRRYAEAQAAQRKE